MSLIKCSHCGREISDKAVMCPHCFYVLKKKEKPKMIKCTECGNEVSDKSLYCPACGYPVKRIISDIELAERKDEYAGYYFFSALVPLIGIIIANVLYSKKYKDAIQAGNRCMLMSLANLMVLLVAFCQIVM